MFSRATVALQTTLPLCIEKKEKINNNNLKKESKQQVIVYVVVYMNMYTR